MLVPWRVFIRQLVATERKKTLNSPINVGRNLFVGFVFFVFKKPLHFITSRQLVRYYSNHGNPSCPPPRGFINHWFPLIGPY